METTRYRLRRNDDRIECARCLDTDGDCRSCDGTGVQVCLHCLRADATAICAEDNAPVCAGCNREALATTAELPAVSMQDLVFGEPCTVTVVPQFGWCAVCCERGTFCRCDRGEVSR